MTINNTKVVDLNIKKDDRVLDFSDFQKQNIKFDINKCWAAERIDGGFIDVVLNKVN